MNPFCVGELLVTPIFTKPTFHRIAERIFAQYLGQYTSGAVYGYLIKQMTVQPDQMAPVEAEPIYCSTHESMSASVFPKSFLFLFYR